MKTLVILAGGKSSRMGRDKVLLSIEEKTFIEHIYEKAREYFDRVIISTDTKAHADKICSLPAFRNAPPEFVTDRYAEKGPMGGIVSVFEATDVRKFAIISVDVPHADMRVLSFLYDNCTGAASFLKFEGHRRESLIAAYSRSAYRPLKESLLSGNYKLRAALEDEKISVFSAGNIAISDKEGLMADFSNYNTPEDLKKLNESPE